MKASPAYIQTSRYCLLNVIYGLLPLCQNIHPKTFYFLRADTENRECYWLIWGLTYLCVHASNRKFTHMISSWIE